MDYRYGIETIDVLIDSLEQTKQQLNKWSIIITTIW